MAYWVHLSHPTRQIRLNANRMFIDEGFVVFQQCQEGGSEYHDDPRRVAAFPANIVDAVYDSDFVERAENIPSLTVGSRIPIETAQHRQETDAERIQRTAAPAVQRAMPQRYPQLTEAEAVPQAYQDPRSLNSETPEPNRFVASWEEQTAPVPTRTIEVAPPSPVTRGPVSFRGITPYPITGGQVAMNDLSNERNTNAAWMAEVAARTQAGIYIDDETMVSPPETTDANNLDVPSVWENEIDFIRATNVGGLVGGSTLPANAVYVSTGTQRERIY